MVHQAEEEWQIGRVDTPLVQREDEAPALGDQQEVGILDAFGDALQAHRAADVVRGKKRLERGVVDRGVDRHGLRGGLRSRPLISALSDAHDACRSGIGGVLKNTSSLTTSTSLTETAKRARHALISSSTSSSGAEAPALTATVDTPSSRRQSMAAAFCTSTALGQPAARPPRPGAPSWTSWASR